MINPSITVILPTYNEAGNMIPLIRSILSHTPASTEILVVDDNSPDGTSQLVRSYMKKNPTKPVRLLLRKRNRGLTNSLRDAIQATKSDIVVWMDCDFSHPPEIIPELLKLIDIGADIAIATRFGKYQGHPDRQISRNGFIIRAGIILSILLNRSLSFLFGSTITDYTTGFLAVRKDVLNEIPLRGDYGEYCIDLLVRAHAMGLIIKEIPYISPPRRSGESKTAPNLITLIKRGVRYITTLLTLVWSIKILGIPKITLPPWGFSPAIHIRPMKPEDVEEVSAIHARVLPTTTAKIGTYYLSHLYHLLINTPHLHTTFVAVSGSHMVGAVTATHNLDLTQHKLWSITVHPRVLLSIGIALMVRRITIQELFTRMRFERQLTTQFSHPYATILTFFVDSKWQHRGIGSQLMAKLLKNIPPRVVYLDTEITNTAAQGWYQGHGFQKEAVIGNNVVFVSK